MPRRVRRVSLRRRRVAAALTGALVGALLVPRATSVIFPERDAPLRRGASTERLARLFEEHGFMVERGPAGTATVLLGAGTSGRPVIVFMTEDDIIRANSQLTSQVSDRRHTR